MCQDGRLPQVLGLDDLAEVAEAIDSSDKLGQVRMSQDLVPTLKTSHRLGPNFIGQPDDPLGGIIGRISRIATNLSPRPVNVLKQLIGFPK